MKYFIIMLLNLILVPIVHAEVEAIVIENSNISKSEIIFSEKDNIEFTIKNLDNNFDEFKSEALNFKLERLPINSEIVVKLPPHKAGVYPFKVEFEDRSYSSKDKNIYGRIIVK